MKKCLLSCLSTLPGRMTALLAIGLIIGSSAKADPSTTPVTSNFNWGVAAWKVWVDNAGSPVVVSGTTVQKLGTDGLVIWTVDLTNDDGFNFSNHLIFDSANNIYLDGYADDRSLAAAVTVVKITSAGAVSWKNKYPVGPVNSSEHMAEGPMIIARNGSLYVLGRMGQFSQSNEPPTLLRINTTTGTELNRRLLTDTIDTAGGMGDSALASDLSSNIYYGHPGGLFSFSADLQSERWFEGTFTTPVRAIVIDRWNNIYVTGTESTGGDPSLWSLYAARLDRNGSVLWKTDLPPSFRGHPYPAPFLNAVEDDRTFGGNLIALDSKGQVLVAGYGSDGVAWNGGLIVKFNPSGGNIQWSHQFGATDVNGTCLAMALDDKDNIYVSGPQGVADPSNPHGAVLTILGPTGDTVQETAFGPFEILENITQVALDKKSRAYWADLSIMSGPNFFDIWEFNTVGRMASAIATTGTGNTKVLMDTFSHDNVLLETFTSGDEFLGTTANWDNNTYGRRDRAISGGPDGNVRILTNRDFDGINSAGVNLVIRNDAGAQLSSNTFNVSNLRATRIATGSDNKSYILFRSTIDESVQVWRMSSNGRREATANFSAIKDNAAVEIAVDGTSIVYLIWQDLNGMVSPWRLNTNLAVTNRTATLNIAGNSVVGAGVGGDHRLRILSNPQFVDGPSLWLLDSSGQLVISQIQGGFAGWFAAGLSVGSDNRSHIIWNDISLDFNQYTVTDADLNQTVSEELITPAP